MRIAMLGHKRIPSREGGVEIVVEELAVRMAALGHKVTCYNRQGHHVSGKEFDGLEIKEYKGVSLKKVLTLNIKGLAAMSSSFFAAICTAFGKYDVVHFHAEGPCAMIWLPKMLGKRCIATVHGLDHQRSKWGRIAKAYILLGERCAAKYADEIIVLSQSNQDYFEKIYGRRTALIPNGVNRPERKVVCEIAEKYGLEKAGYLLFLGRIVPEKGVHYLIEAFQELKTDKKLVIAGGASDSADYYQRVREIAKNDERIVFTGFVQGQVLQELYSNAYSYVQPSDLEGMSLSLLEAMSYGNCCVVSDIPECAGVVQDKGLVFERGNVTALRSVLHNLIMNEGLVEKYREMSADFVCEQYDWNDVVNRTLALY